MNLCYRIKISGFLFAVLLLFFLQPQAISLKDARAAELRGKNGKDEAAQALLSLTGKKWKQDESPHFFYFYVRRNDFAKYSKRAESYFEKTGRIIGSTQEVSEKCRVFLVPDSSAWNQFLGRVQMRRNVAGFYTGSGIFFNCGQSSLYKDAEKTFAHEICHLIFMHFWGREDCPLWLNEGMAGYVSGEVQKFPKRLSPYSSLEWRKKWLSLSDLTQMESYPKGEDENFLFYRQAEWLVKFLAEKNDPRLFGLFLKELKAAPRDFSKAMLKVYKKQYSDIKAFEKAYAAFSRKQTRY